MNTDFALGTHLTTPRKMYIHHGIYIGQKKVIHYSGLRRDFHFGPIEEVSLDTFCNGRSISICQDESVFISEEIVKRAKSRIGENQYNLFFNNCEHFAVWCATGKSKSKQVEALASLPGSAFQFLVPSPMLKRLVN